VSVECSHQTSHTLATVFVLDWWSDIVSFGGYVFIGGLHMRSIIKLAVAAAILSIGSTQAFADSNFDSGKLDECGSLTKFYNKTLSG